MLLEKIEALRKQPKPVRDRYAFGVALVTTVVIVLVWITSLPARLEIKPTIVEDDSDKSPSVAEHFSGMRDLFGESISEIKSQAKLLESQGLSGATTSATTTATSTDLDITELLAPWGASATTTDTDQ